MKGLLYDWLGLNEWLFTKLYFLHFPGLAESWRVASYFYSYWAVAMVALVICLRYLRIRYKTREAELERMGAFLVELIAAFSIVWSAVYTFQNIGLMPRPWVVLPDLVAEQAPLIWHEGLPSSNSAIAVMLVTLAWRHLDPSKHKFLVTYLVLGCVMSIVSGVNWPIEVVAGLLLGWLAAKAGQRYLRFARQIVAP